MTSLHAIRSLIARYIAFESLQITLNYPSPKIIKITKYDFLIYTVSRKK